MKFEFGSLNISRFRRPRKAGAAEVALILLKQPSPHHNQGVARIKVAAMPSPEELFEVCEEYYGTTGFRLQVIV
jgi:hypothetical protein